MGGFRLNEVEFRDIKKEIRLVGFDDGSFEPHTEGRTCLVGVVSRGGQFTDGVLVDRVKIDGMDSTSTLVEMVNETRHKDQIRIILTSGITFAGFNVLNVNEVFERTGLPVIVVSRKKPDMKSVKLALKNLPEWEKRWEILNSAGDIIPVDTEDSGGRKTTIYIQIKGIKNRDARKVVSMSCTRSSIPEPLRMAHIIATAISRGESVGRV